MKINPEWASIAAFFAVSLILAFVHVVAFVVSIPSRFIYLAAIPLQRLLVRLSRPRAAQ